MLVARSLKSPPAANIHIRGLDILSISYSSIQIVNPANGNIRVATIGVSQDRIGPSAYRLNDGPMIVSGDCLPLGAGGDENVIRQLSIETSM